MQKEKEVLTAINDLTNTMFNHERSLKEAIYTLEIKLAEAKAQLELVKKVQEEIQKIPSAGN